MSEMDAGQTPVGGHAGGSGLSRPCANGAAEREVPAAPPTGSEVGVCLWANQICEQPNHHGCKTCLSVEPTRPTSPGGFDA